MGQASCAVTYQRRLSSLVNFTDIKTARSLLRDNTESLGKVSKDLFGKDFKAHLKAETKVSKDAEDYFSQHSSKKTTLKPPSKPLFRSGPFPNQRGRGNLLSKSRVKEGKKPISKDFQVNILKKNLFQHANTTRLVANTETCPSFNKTNVSDKCSRYAFCRKNKTFSSKLAKTVKRPSHTKHCQRLGDSTVRGTSSTKRTSSNSNEQFGIRSNRSGSRQHVEKRGNKNCYSKTRADLEQHFCASKKRGEISTNYKSKTDELLYSLPSSQDGGVEGCEEYSPKSRFSLQLDLKDAYFSIPLSTKSRKYVRFRWKGNLYEFLCLAFGLGPAPRIFTKLMKVPISILRRINIRLIIYLDDMLLMAASLSEILMARDSTMFLLHHLGLVVNLEKSIWTPQTRLEFLGITIDSQTMTFSLPVEKTEKLRDLCQETSNSQQITLRELSSLIGKLRATAPAIIPAPLQLRYLQQVLIKAQRGDHYETSVGLTQDCIVELKWWINNLHLQKGKPLNLEPPEIIIQSDAATSGGWSASTKDLSTGGTWTKEERKLHINILELMAVELAVKTFTRNRKVSSIHLQIDNTVALSYLMKMGGTKSWELTKISKRIWHYLLDKEITLTAEWIPTQLNIVADWESRNVKDSTEWKLSQTIFQKICKAMGTPNIDLFASRVSHQVPTYLSLKADPCCQAVDAIQQDWNPFFPYAFPPFCLISKVLRQLIVQTKSGKNDISYPIMANPTMVSSPTIHVHPKSNLDRHNRKLIRKPIGREAPINSKLNSRVSGLAGLRDTLSAEGISSRASELIINARREGTRLNYESAWKKWFLWCSRKQVNPLAL